MIVGTAGHIDHGKTALLQALTGARGDRRREERERGITIDLGYAYADLGADQPCGFIDVPGHERFVHNMLAGASGIDLLLLVVAADDGVMPQTREHLSIAELLGIPRALVAITKVDRVEPARLHEVQQQVAALLAAGRFAGAPQFAVSAVQEKGIDVLRSALAAEARQALERSQAGHFRLAIDRAFSVAGAGVVVTGTAFAGQVSVGDELKLSPSGRTVRVRGLHAQNQKVDEAHAGQRVALNIAGDRVTVQRIHRGEWLVAPALHAPVTRLDIQLDLLTSEARALRHWSPVHIHLGAHDLTGRVALLQEQTLEPGGRALAQLVLNAPTHAVHGDRLVLRDQSAQRTIGGGQVLDPFAPARHRRTPERIAQLQALAAGSLEDAFPGLLEQSHQGLEPWRLERQFNRPAGSWALPAGVLAVATHQGPRLFNEPAWHALQNELEARLGQFHEEQPDELGPDRDRLRRYAMPGLERPVFVALLESLLAAGRIEASGPWLHQPGHRVRLTADEERLQSQIWPLLEEGGYDPPWVRDLARTLEREESEVRLLLRKLARLGQLQQVVKDLFYPEGTLRSLAAVAMELARRNGVIATADFRDRIGLGRKRSIQLLEHFDRIGLTRRVGDLRRIRPDNALATSEVSTTLTARVAE
ncbi:selenocysteine-specific translation elongation factor [Pseudomonas sp. OIL-1]|uniref:selenocysteine-specific translation elongation factor n=1 Tax=Pseudomonas sp. OIL-1 TaxID=2706126 RepID=UPI0013A70D73|nr:selenocysteine-specific translation elongation factor [Pseudomonas sp. OIL-1]QIB52254.1 selenocysteine-specific translation elongation factor [Pseudomonas sp. OIL-1]